MPTYTDQLQHEKDMLELGNNGQINVEYHTFSVRKSLLHHTVKLWWQTLSDH